MFNKYYNLCESFLNTILVLEANDFLSADFKKKILNSILAIEKEKLSISEKRRNYMEVKKELFTYLIKINYKNINNFFSINQAGKRILTPKNAKRLDEFLENLIKKLKEEDHRFTKITRNYISSYKG